MVSKAYFLLRGFENTAIGRHVLEFDVSISGVNMYEMYKFMLRCTPNNMQYKPRQKLQKITTSVLSSCQNSGITENLNVYKFRIMGIFNFTIFALVASKYSWFGNENHFKKHVSFIIVIADHCIICFLSKCIKVIALEVFLHRYFAISYNG